MFGREKTLTFHTLSEGGKDRWQFDIVRLFEDRHDRQDIERAIVAHPSHVCFAMYGKAVIAAAAALPDADCYEAVLLCCVLPRWRHRGLGTEVLARTIRSLNCGIEPPWCLGYYLQGDSEAAAFLARFGLQYKFTDMCMTYEGGRLPVDPAVKIVPYEDRWYEEMVRLRNQGVAEDQILKSLNPRPLFSADDDLYRSWMDSHASQAFVLLVDSCCRGFVMAAADGEVRSLVVDPEVRGRGYGQALVATAVNRQVDLGRPQIFLWVAGRNDKAIHIYRKAGFEVEAVFDCARGKAIIPPR